MATVIHKVTCFIIRDKSSHIELLLFQHPNAGVQIPAGTVNTGEMPEIAAQREAREETGLDRLKLVRFIGEESEPPPAGQSLIAYSTPVYAGPRSDSSDWAHFPTSLAVIVLRRSNDFTQVCYEEQDRYPDPRYTTYSITGWVPDEALTDQRIRHYYLFEHTGESPEQWSIATDNHTFKLFWAPLNNLPRIIPPQDGWIAWLVKRL